MFNLPLSHDAVVAARGYATSNVRLEEEDGKLAWIVVVGAGKSKQEEMPLDETHREYLRLACESLLPSDKISGQSYGETKRLCKIKPFPGCGPELPRDIFLLFGTSKCKVWIRNIDTSSTFCLPGSSSTNAVVII